MQMQEGIVDYAVLLSGEQGVEEPLCSIEVFRQSLQPFYDVRAGDCLIRGSICIHALYCVHSSLFSPAHLPHCCAAAHRQHGRK
jgi:hypothetical protein